MLAQLFIIAMAEERNPSPPPIEENGVNGTDNSDKIGDTAFSKRFILSSLLDILKETSQAENDCEDIAELNDNLETSLCQVWDMSVNPEVGNFLLESDAIPIFTGAINVSNKPRLVEILVGILGNIACDEENLKRIIESDDMINLCFVLLGCRDTPTLIETTRLILHVVERKMWTEKWDDCFETMDGWNNVAFILSSTTNEKLLTNTSQIVDILVDTGNSYVMHQLICKPPESWQCLMHALEEAITSKNLPACEPLSHCIHSMTLTEESGKALVTSADCALETVGKCISLFSSDSEDVTINDLNTLHCGLSIWKCLLPFCESFEFASHLPLVEKFLKNISSTEMHNDTTQDLLIRNCFEVITELKCNLKENGNCK